LRADDPAHRRLEPDFARLGEGHDKGAAESRGKAIRLQHLTPVPRGESLAAVSQALLLDLEQAISARRIRDGQRASTLRPPGRIRGWVTLSFRQTRRI
jgi:hypothetical protein